MWALGAEELGLNPDSFQVTDLLDGNSYQWGQSTYVRLDPARPNGKVAHIALVKTK
jgi:starch synthase (maltosyl-transferring)